MTWNLSLGRPLPRPRLRRRGVLCVLVVALLAACAMEPPAAVDPASHRVLFVGLDGATWTVMGPMIERGELPTFARLIEEGAYMERFGTMETTLSPIVWTTVATGREPAVHGIEDFAVTLPDGSLIPASGAQRKARAIWELASRRGRSVGVIGWWATWPAEAVDGYMISDHANPAFSRLMRRDGRYWTADPEELSEIGLDFLPEDLAPLLAEHWIDRDAFPWDDLQRRGGFTDAQMEAIRQAPWDERQVHSWLKMFYGVDRPLVEVAVELAQERPTDLQLLYLRAADPVQHYGWDLVEPQAFAEPPEDLERDRGLVEGVYRYLDGFLAELMATRRPGDWLIVASDHGAEPTRYAQQPERMFRSGDHTTAAKGVLFLHGPGVRPGHRLRGADPYDLFPTLAWLLGLPLSEELPGVPLTGAFESEFARGLPVRTVPTYGPRPPQPLRRSVADEAMLDNLRSLGYID